MGATAWEDSWIHQSWYLCSTATPVGSVAINSMRIRSRKNTPDLRALKAADGKQARPSPPPGQMVKWYNMLSKKPQHILSTAVMVLIVLSALVCPWLMSKSKPNPLLWLISELCKCVCVCGRYFGSAPQTTADLETDYISEQRRKKNKETDFILTHRRGITTNDDISQRKEKEKSDFDEVLNLWEISLILKWNIPDISFLSLCIAIGKKKQNNCLSYAVLTWDLKSPISKMFLLNRLFSEIQKRS